MLLDLWATVPYYTAYLARALREIGVPVRVTSITYYLDRDTLRRCGLQAEPGVSDIVGRLNLGRTTRRLLKLAEGAVNLLALSVAVLLRPPAVLHVQFLPLLLSRLPLDRWFVELCRRRGVPFVLTVHDLLPHDTGQTHRAAYAQLYRQADALICHSAHVRQRLVQEFGIAAERVTVIAHGPFFYDLPSSPPEPTRARLGVKDGQQMVLWQGILFPYKGVDLLLAAWQKVERQTQGQACLVILGTGAPDLLASLTAQARALGLRDVRFHFTFCSAQELVAAYRAATVVVYPYRAITTSGALATGLSLGKAIVASPLPVFEELLQAGQTALFADPSNPEALAATLLTLLQDTDLRLRLERNVGAMRFSERSWEAIAQSTAKVYSAVAAGRE